MSVLDGQNTTLVIPQTSIVTDPRPVVTPDAVAAFSNAFRNGQITTQDLVDHISEKARLENEARKQASREFVDPNAIAARQAVISAAGSEAQLAQARAQAGLPLVAPQSQYDAQKLERAKVDINSKNAVDAFLKWNAPVYKEDPETGEKTNQLDYDTMSEHGTEYLKAENMLTIAQQGLAGTKTETTDAKGQKRIVYLNHMGEDVTPVPGNKVFEYYAGLRRDAIDAFHYTPKVKPRMSGSGVPTPPPAPAEPVRLISPNEVAPSNEVNNAMRAAAVEKLGVAPAQASVMSPRDLATASSLVSPVAPAVAAPVVEPAAVAGYQPMTGMPAGPEPGTTNPEIEKRKNETPAYKEWAEKINVAKLFNTNAKAIMAIPEHDQSSVVMNEKDAALTSTIRQLLSASQSGGTSGRGTPEMQIAAMEERQPWSEKIKDWKQLAFKTGVLTPEQRQRLISLGNMVIASREDSARKALLQAMRDSKGSLTLGEDEVDLLSGKSLQATSGEGSHGAENKRVVNTSVGSIRF